MATIRGKGTEASKQQNKAEAALSHRGTEADRQGSLPASESFPASWGFPALVSLVGLTGGFHLEQVVLQTPRS